MTFTRRASRGRAGRIPQSPEDLPEDSPDGARLILTRTENKLESDLRRTIRLLRDAEHLDEAHDWKLLHVGLRNRRHELDHEVLLGVDVLKRLDDVTGRAAGFAINRENERHLDHA